MDNNTRIKDISDPLVFVALKRMSKYLVDTVWRISFSTSSVEDIQLTLAQEKTKKHEEEITVFSEIDLELSPELEITTHESGTKTGRLKKGSNFFYSGDLTLFSLLDSIEEYCETVHWLDEPTCEDVEFMHFFEYLKNLITIPHQNPQAQNMRLYDERQFHPAIDRVSRSLFQSEHYPQAVFEATKALNNYVKDISNLSTLDGKELMSRAFNTNNGTVKLNDLSTESFKNEQEGYMHMLMGIMQGIRNPKAHDEVTLEDPIRALDFLSLVNLLIKKIEERPVTQTHSIQP